MQVLTQRIYVALSVRAFLIQRGGDQAVLVGLDVAESEILDFPFELPDPQPIGKRREDRARLDRKPLPFIVGKLPRVAQAHKLLREPRKHQAWVADYRKQHLAQHFSLP